MRRALRQCPLTGAWVALCSDHVAEGPSLHEPPGPASACPFCRGPEAPIEALGEPVSCWAIPHRVPVVRVEERTEGRPEGLGWELPGLGAHEVVVESARHAPLADQSPEVSEAALRLARRRHADLQLDQRMAWLGWQRTTGGQLAHPHAEVVALPIVPRAVAAERDWLAHHGQRLQRVMDAERRYGQRVVWDGDGVLAWCAAAPAVPFEVRLAVDDAGPSWMSATEVAIGALARALRRVERGLDRALGPHRRRVVLHQDALHGARVKGWWLQVLPETRIRARALGGVVAGHPGWPDDAAGVLRPLCHDAPEEEGDLR